MRSTAKYTHHSRREETKRMPRMTSTALRDENKVGIKHVNKNALSRLLKIIFSDHRAL